MIPVEFRGGRPWSLAMAVSTSVVSFVTSARSEVKVTAPVSLFKAKYGQLPSEKLQPQGAGDGNLMIFNLGTKSSGEDENQEK